MNAEDESPQGPACAAWINTMLSARPAVVLQDAGFHSSGLEFVRVLNDVTQTVSFSIVDRPVHAPGRLQLVGHVDLRLDAAERIYRLMMESAPELRSGRPMRTPFDSLRDRPGATWLFRDEASARDLARPVGRALVDYVLPYCDRTDDYRGVLDQCRDEIYRSLDLLAALGRTPDLIGPRAVFAAAVGIAIGENSVAREILHYAYPPDSGSRDRYSSAFEYPIV